MFLLRTSAVSALLVLAACSATPPAASPSTSSSFSAPSSQGDVPTLQETEAMKGNEGVKGEGRAESVQASSVPETEEQGSSPEEDDAAPEADSSGHYEQGYYRAGGAEALSSDIIGNGRVSLIFFYAAWCPFCTEKEALLMRLYASEAFTLSTYKVDYDASSALKQRFGVTTQDTVVLINGEGEVQETIIGATEDDLRRLLAGD